tara:strand:- start:472 stop:990 length:519 start_codon:yes stop_codon:yes gene_type:complete
MRNFIYQKDNFLTTKECADLVNKLKDDLKPGEEEYHGYSSRDLEGTEDYSVLQQKIIPLLKDYGEYFPEVNFTSDYWTLTHMRFKLFEAGQSFEKWHSEHSLVYSTRLLNIMMYLTEHNCGTEFYKGEYIKSEVGRIAIFPSYFTHAHRGQKCPDNRIRCIITGYVNFIKVQ